MIIHGDRYIPAIAGRTCGVFVWYFTFSGEDEENAMQRIGLHAVVA